MFVGCPKSCYSHLAEHFCVHLFVLFFLSLNDLFLFLEVCPQILVLWANFDGCFEVSEGSLMVSHCAIGLRSSVVSFGVGRVYLDHLTSHVARGKV